LTGRRRAGENAHVELTPTPPSVGLALVPQSKRIERHRRKTQQMKFSTSSGVTPRTMPAAWIRQRFLQEDLRWLCGTLLAVSAFTGLFSDPARAQQTDPATPVVVQPGAPGKPSRRLPPSTKATLPPRSQADVEFMQGMIMHHSQAVGDDGADSVAYGEQRSAVAGGANQQLAVGRNKSSCSGGLAARGESVSHTGHRSHGCATCPCRHSRPAPWKRIRPEPPAPLHELYFVRLRAADSRPQRPQIVVLRYATESAPSLSTACE